MENEILTIPKQQTVEKEPIYLSLDIFREQFFEDEEDFLYHSKFSLSLLLDKWRQKSVSGKSSIAAAATAMLEEVELALKDMDAEKKIANLPALKEVMELLFPCFFFKEQIGFISVPFSRNFVFISDAFQSRVESDEWEVQLTGKNMDYTSARFTLEVAGVILNKFYGQDLEMCQTEIMTLRHKESKLERHYKINKVTDYVQVKAVKPLKPLSQSQIQELLNNTENTDLFLQCLPPENFAFEGFFIGYLTDVTDVETLSKMKARLAQDEGYIEVENHHKILNFLEQQICSFMNIPNLEIGCLQMIMGGWQERTSWSIFRHCEGDYSMELFNRSNETYRKVFKSHDPVVVGDLAELSNRSELENLLLQRGVRSLLLVPLINNDGNINGVFEMALKEPYRFSELTINDLKEIIALFAVGIERGQREIQKEAIAVLQEQFTAMHPSVAWRFNEAAYNYMFRRRFEGNQAVIESIVFQDIYPLYGQADIVGSSTLRNDVICADLITNLQQIEKVLRVFREKLSFHLLDMRLLEVKTHLERLQLGFFVSSDESQIVELLKREIHPLLKHLVANHPQLPTNLLQEYFSLLDPELEIVYCRRREYEESVRILNRKTSAFLEEADQKMQKVLPHFFEKYKTDGVEYNIYLGQSILQKGEFNHFYLKDFRLWQLINMCEITRLVAKTAPTLPIPLQTAQLIFVYNNSLSIRFRMDEKKFDVDGSYNVRYEILKKRIDKAVIKGTGERLTQSGKIAIVWLQEKDRQEYIEYLTHLYMTGYIEEEIEDLELEKLQGADGLRALRVTVKEEYLK
ncbi:MAG: GAF domain-containing protein [Chitinophagales bacterium]